MIWLSTMPNQSLYLRFLRKDATSDLDDVVQIKSLREDLYSVTYTYGESAKPSKGTQTAYLDSNGIYQYIRSLLQLLQQDVDPFEFVQFDFPLMPSILFRIDSLKSREYHTILEALECHLNNQTVSNDYKRSNDYKYSNDYTSSNDYKHSDDYTSRSNEISNTHQYFSDSD